jgi:hypothetical protein
MNKNRLNYFILNKESFIDSNSDKVLSIAEILNEQRLIIIKWLRNFWKLNFIKEFLSKTKTEMSYFYFNKNDDIEDTITNEKDLENFLNKYIQIYKKPKIIILQNIFNIIWIKDFITKIYSEWYKIILIWNNIKISNIKEIEVGSNYNNINYNNIDNISTFWLWYNIKTIEQDFLKKNFLKLTTSDILLHDIAKGFSVKSIDLYIFTITFLSKINDYISYREFHLILNELKSISLKTLIDYIDYSIQARIIKKVFRFDLKTNKTISSKAKYYFTDNWIRNSLFNFNVEKRILTENLIFNILYYNNFSIYWGVNWKFSFTFYWEKETVDSKKEKIHILISYETRKDELRKEVNKLLKIWNSHQKFLLVDSIEELWIKKLQYDSVTIMEINEFISSFKQKN